MSEFIVGNMPHMAKDAKRDPIPANDNTFEAAESVGQLLGMLAGAASMCWEPQPTTAVFDSTAASSLVSEALSRLKEMMNENTFEQATILCHLWSNSTKTVPA